MLTLSLSTGIDGSAHGSDDQPPAIHAANDNADAKDDENDNGGPIAGQTVLAHVDLAKTVRELPSFHCVVTIA